MSKVSENEIPTLKVGISFSFSFDAFVRHLVRHLKYDEKHAKQGRFAFLFVSITNCLTRAKMQNLGKEY